MKNEIKAWIAGKANCEYSVGMYVKTVGRKYVTVVNTWDTTRIERIPLADFYAQYVA